MRAFPSPQTLECLERGRICEKVRFEDITQQNTTQVKSVFSLTIFTIFGIICDEGILRIDVRDYLTVVLLFYCDIFD